MRPNTRLQMMVIAGFAAAVGSCVNDPVQNTRLSALGDDFPAGLEETAYHRPGQPCLTCHDEKRGSSSAKFAVAGTIFWGTCNIDKTEAADDKVRNERCDLTPVRDAEVRLINTGGGRACAVTNCWGNFTFPTNDARIEFPFLVSVAKKGLDGQYLVQTQMGGHISREGSCAGCHDNPRRADSPGQVYLFAEDGRTGKVGIPPAARAVMDKDRTFKCPNEEPLRTCE
jgi:hypothetical protein